MRKALLAIITAALASVAIMSPGNSAFAQSDRTLGINCTVAGHQHCGETGGYWGHRRHRHYR
jgi:hypothetical protein